jgi:hypothetical protein
MHHIALRRQTLHTFHTTFESVFVLDFQFLFLSITKIEMIPSSIVDEQFIASLFRLNLKTRGISDYRRSLLVLHGPASTLTLLLQ